ncbi:MAG: hypothetical protein ABUS56_06705 [Acidobacteriota bacterium]
MLREFLLAARRPALTAVLCLHVALVAGFTLVWHRGMPVLAGANPYEQQRLVQWIVLWGLLPWTAVRCAAPDGATGLARVSAVLAVRPSSVVVAKFLALSGVLMLVGMAGLPAVILALQMSALPLSALPAHLFSLAALALLVAAAAVASSLAVQGRLAAWLLAAGSSGVVLLALSASLPAGLLAWLAAGATGSAIAAATARWSDTAHRYCYE